MANTARWPGVHTDWLFYFPVDDLDASVDKVRAHGAKARTPAAFPSGACLAACEGPQGAAFGLYGQLPREGLGLR